MSPDVFELDLQLIPGAVPNPVERSQRRGLADACGSVDVVELSDRHIVHPLLVRDARSGNR